MPDLYGPIQQVTISGTLWLLVAPPLAAAIYAAWRALAVLRDQLPSPRANVPDARTRQSVASLSIGAVGLSFGVAIYHAVLLGLHAPEQRFFLQHLWRLVRLGQLDANADLAFDPLTATMALVITGVGLPIFVFAAEYMKDDASFARFFAWLNGFVAAMLVLVLADNFLLLFFGWEGVGLCSWGLIGFWWHDAAKPRAGRKAFVVNRVGDAGFLLGVAFLYWGLGGSWIDNEYAPGLGARFSSVEVRDAPEKHDVKREPAAGAHDLPMPGGHDEGDDTTAVEALTGEGYVTLTEYSGAVVFMDDARAPLRQGSEPLRAPFVRFPVKGGIHSFRIHPGGGLDDFLVTRVPFGGGREIALTPFGPSVSFRNVRDQLAARDAQGKAQAREALVANKAWKSVPLLTIVCLLLFVGAVGKSAQFPLFIWLPDAMAGPTPVSALIHAATMVTAGIYLVARLSFLFALSGAALTVIAVVGAGTALFAAVAGLYQHDLKRILAYSTVSQLGFMVLGVGVGAYEAGVFHLVTHACFKACLFLAAGAVLHALHPVEHVERKRQDVRRMGGLRRVLPKTARAYFIACLAITAAPIPGLSGFWSKDEILTRAFLARNLGIGGPVLGGVALLAAALTSFYMWRSWYLTFEGEPRTPLSGVHEVARPMTAVLEVLAVASAVAGALGWSAALFGGTGDSLLGGWLAPVLRLGPEEKAVPPAASFAVAGGAYVLALGGWALARARYGVARAKDWDLRERRVWLYAPSAHAFWVDALYSRILVPLTSWVAGFLAEFDHRVIDGLVNAAAGATRAVGWVVGRTDDGIVDGAVRGLSNATLAAGEKVRAAQTGRIQTYVYAISLGVLAISALQYWLR